MSEQKKPTMYIAIGPSGSGKSTLFKQMKIDNPEITHYSWDNLRHEWYDPVDYSKAFEKSCKDSKFHSKAMAVLTDILKNGKSVFVDNVNLTRRSRKEMLDVAHRYGYHTVGLVFSPTKELLLQRQKSRQDKTVPKEAVLKQLENLKAPIQGDGEFDEVVQVQSSPK